MIRILVVCTGNTCRSPMAAGLLARLAELRGVALAADSAGTLGWNERGASPGAVDVMAEVGVDLSAHRSRRVTAADITGADLVLGMTREHVWGLRALAPGAAGRIFLPAEWVRTLKQQQVERGAFSPEVVAGLVADRVAPAVPGRASDEVADPAGHPHEVYRETRDRLWSLFETWADRSGVL